MPEKAHLVEAVSIEAIGTTQQATAADHRVKLRQTALTPATAVSMRSAAETRETPVFYRDTLNPGDRIDGPAMIIEAGATTIIETGWQAEVTPQNHLVLVRVAPLPKRAAVWETAALSTPSWKAAR